jgi:hypothetical protein
LGLAVGAAPVAAQIDLSDIDLEFHSGLAVPAGDLSEVGATGASFGLALAKPVSQRWAVRLDGHLEVLSERLVGDAIMPRTFLWHYHAGLELDVLSGSSPWLVKLLGGAGGTTYDTQRLVLNGDDFFDTYFSVSGGVAVGRQVWDHLEVGVVGQSYVVFTDKDRTGELAARSSLLNTFSKASSFPIEIYLRWVR